MMRKHWDKLCGAAAAVVLQTATAMIIWEMVRSEETEAMPVTIEQVKILDGGGETRSIFQARVNAWLEEERPAITRITTSGSVIAIFYSAGDHTPKERVRVFGGSVSAVAADHGAQLEQETNAWLERERPSITRTALSGPFLFVFYAPGEPPKK